MWVVCVDECEKFVEEKKAGVKERKGSCHLRQSHGKQCWRQERHQGQLVMCAGTEQDSWLPV